ncbi:hypothetical protein F5Y03DRAFT_350690 [Xylaria venustula]|nr:hypothetical protein F5Y03DRAFT_350690 [Xylaria venustula]
MTMSARKYICSCSLWLFPPSFGHIRFLLRIPSLSRIPPPNSHCLRVVCISFAMLSKRRSSVLALIIVLACSLTFATLNAQFHIPGSLRFNSAEWRSKSSPVTPASSSLPQPNDTITTTPLEYHSITEAEQSCSRFSPAYFQDFLDHATSYCTPDSAAKLTCFHRASGFDDKTDSFCYARGAVLDVEQKKFHLSCALRKFSEQETTGGLLPFDRLPGYWYETGPANIFQAAIDVEPSAGRRNIDRRDEEKGSSQSEIQLIGENPMIAPPKTLLLVKREGDTNPWHCLMEIFSTWMTFDILRMPSDLAGGQPPFFRHPLDSKDTQVVILDDHPDGPFLDLWRLYAQRRPMRLAELLADQTTAEYLDSVNLIIPLAGSSNPFWKDDAQAQQCANSQTLSIFGQRVLDFAGVQTPYFRTPKDYIVVTFVWRRQSRRLNNENWLLAELGRRNPRITVQVVDFATLSFSEQVRIAHKSDVLVGVHGAGLTHSIFMRQGEGAVVEIQPKGLDHHGFRNVAGMRNLGYYRTHAKIIPSETWSSGEQGPVVDNVQTVKRTQAGTDGENYDNMKVRRGNIDKREEWHFNDIEIEAERFFQIVETAVNYMYNKGPWSLDMN